MYALTLGRHRGDFFLFPMPAESGGALSPSAAVGGALPFLLRQKGGGFLLFLPSPDVEEFF